MRDHIEDVLGYTLTGNQVAEVKRMCRDLIYGSESDNVKMLPALFERFKKDDPDTYTDIR